jgi:hypothetical protein
MNKKDKIVLATTAIVGGGLIITGIVLLTRKKTPPPSNTLVSLALTPISPAALNIGDTQQFIVMGTYSDGSVIDLTGFIPYLSSNTSVATIDATGIATGVSAGSTTISAYLGNVTSNGVTLNVTSGVVGPTLVSIAVTPGSSSVEVSMTQQFTATGTYSDSTTADISSQVTWASNNTGVATIDSTGLATGVETGVAVITAALSGIKSPSVDLTVNPYTITASITGTIVDNSSGFGISGATLLVYADNNLITTVNAAANGSFTIEDLSTIVPYVIDVSAPNYNPTTYDIELTQATTNISIPLQLTSSTPTGTYLNGLITNFSSHAAVPNATVTLFALTSGFPTIDSAITNANGYYEMVNLTPGTYGISLTATGYQSGSIDITIVSGANTKSGTIQPG